jgi:uncharacterized phage protein (TIGR02220 family)
LPERQSVAMSRLRNRILKAAYYTDGELLRWPRDKREFYRSLWACAEDSCCLEDDMFEVKMTAWASPMDADLTVEILDTWRDELIAEGKAVRYEAEGKNYLYLPHMAEHEKPRNAQAPDLPLPPWVTCEIAGNGQGRRVTYTHHPPSVQSPSGRAEASVQSPSGNRNTTPAQPSPALSSPELQPLSGRPDVSPPEKPSKKPPPYAEIISYLNERAGTKYLPTVKSTQALIRARFAEGFTVEDFRTVVDRKCAEWLTDPKWVKFLRPETLFSGKFATYLGSRDAPSAQPETDYRIPRIYT